MFNQSDWGLSYLLPKREDRIIRTNNQSKILEFTGASLDLDREKMFIKESLHVMGGFLVHSDLVEDVKESTVCR